MSKSTLIHHHKNNNFDREHVIVKRTAGLGDPCIDGRSYTITIGGDVRFMLNFQEGSVTEVGANGLTNEALIAVVIDRLECFQRGAYKCRENALAITKLEEAMHWLGHRSADRERCGVEGKMLP
jgi:hypothetical protein